MREKEPGSRRALSFSIARIARAKVLEGARGGLKPGRLRASGVGKPLAQMDVAANILLCREPAEENSWNPDLAAGLRDAGAAVTEARGLEDIRRLDLDAFDICLPRFRVNAAHMACVDEALVRSGIPMMNSRRVRMQCENKALAHLAFEESGIPQPASFVVSAEGEVDREPRWEGETLVKPLAGARGAGIEVFGSLPEAVSYARGRGEDSLVQEMIWPARSWRVIVGRTSGVVDPYWRRPPSEEDRILSIGTGSTIVRERSERVDDVARRMLQAVDGDLLAMDVLETEEGAYALEINHNFDAHGATEPAVEAFLRETNAIARLSPV
ncbi:MAG TPA: hypothetical protein VEP28_01385 [Rubrobacter sp.]|nr:hypothetical protein [Rubrobacter sp.]